MPDSTTLLFVSNLDSRVLQSLHDYSSGRAAASEADLCALTRIIYSPVGIKKEWKRFLKECTIPPRSLSRDEFTKEFGNLAITFPVVLIKKGTELSVLISTEEINRFDDLHDFIRLVGERISLV
ncbi:MAG: hypothetical protein M0R30_00270 [Methanoregula sp.]|jgi:hypothetical protein|uniref:hypothetical protein n=1 Tax=Methanoregula sp. TaxID=2052170 RepID=UPI0025E9F24E|nr:hypothetical protein [Methanoregula sp.]MCK9630054.1 hypothetical protein [Methanoregula sp.]